MNAMNENRPATVSRSKIGSLQSAALLAISFLFGCAGKTGAPPTEGTLSSCGSGCTGDQIAAACSSICMKAIQAGCPPDQDVSSCTQSCTKFANDPKCMSKNLDSLRCVEGLTPTCKGNEADYGAACLAVSQQAQMCARAGLPGALNDDPSVCPDIPRPTSGGGACVSGGTAPTADDAGLTCAASCQDDTTGALWEANCSGTTCTCTYNRAQTCTCTMKGGGACSSCCPGTPKGP